MPGGPQQAIFAGGCLWCLEPVFDGVAGIKSTQPGYLGGNTPEPTYKQVEAGTSGHYFATRITFDPARISYRKLLELFWLNIDPFDAEGQFCDRGAPFRTAIFYLNDNQHLLASESRARLSQSRPNEAVATAVLAASEFHEAEDYYQDFYLKHAQRYRFYQGGCDRAPRLQAIDLQPAELADSQ